MGNLISTIWTTFLRHAILITKEQTPVDIGEQFTIEVINYFTNYI
jgi:hypothetical protein